MAEGYFLDTSALFKRYVAETGSEGVARLFDGRDPLFISAVTLCEVVQTCAAWWTWTELSARRSSWR
ncbi:MAG: hypothetical protein QME76_12135 [Bacillota bacterium]|nr:hypothetical protein [Bacillota bacterium]